MSHQEARSHRAAHSEASHSEMSGQSMAPAPFQLKSGNESSAALPANPVAPVMPAPPMQLMASHGGMCGGEEAESSELVEQTSSQGHENMCGGDAGGNGDGSGGGGNNPPANPAVNIDSPSFIAVDFLASHAMTQYGGDIRNNPLWRPGSVDHAAAYTKGSNPNTNAQIGLGAATELAGNTEATVRVLENNNEIGRKDSVPVTNSLISVERLLLQGLSGFDAVRCSTNVLSWQITFDGGTWIDLGQSGGHRLYWLEGAPTLAGVTNYAIDKATGFANGAADAPAAIRSGMRGVINYDPADGINPDPLTVFNDGVGICTDFGNLLVVLAQSVGFNANPVMFFGGFESLGRNVWICRGGSYTNLTQVNALDNAYHPGGGATGWDFNYHVIARINGQLQDAALNRPGYDAQAVHGGKTVYLLELAAGNLPAAQVGLPYSATIPRRPHTVAVTLRDYAGLVTNAAFDPSNLIALKIPEAVPSPIPVGVGWAAAAGIPAGLSITGAQGLLSGTPTTAGSFNFQVTTSGAGVSTNGQFNIDVTNP